MNTDILHRIDAGAAPLGNDVAAPEAAGAGAAESTNFRRLLESLQQLARDHRQMPPVEDATQLQDAIRRVDDGFVTAMDLRRKLEEAFRGRLP